jgi:membrane-associated phospholipid phosphatase
MALILPVAVSYGSYYYLLLFLIPLVIWARLKTKRHTFKEIFIGGTVGGFLSLSLYYIARFFLNR